MNLEVHELLKVNNAHNEKVAIPLIVEIDRKHLRELINREHKFNYSAQNAALDTGVGSVIMASKNHMDDDKFKHLVVGALIGYGVTEVAKVYFKNSNQVQLKSILAGVGAAALIGLAKEIRDKQGYGTPDIKDFYYTAAGGALVSVRYSIKF